MALLIVHFNANAFTEDILQELRYLGLCAGNLNTDYEFKILGNFSDNFALVRVPDSGAADYIRALLEVSKATEVKLLPVESVGDTIDNLDEQTPA